MDRLRLGPAIVLLLASSLTVLAPAIVAPTLPGLRAAFAGQAGVELLARLVLTMPALGVILGAGIAGTLADRLGRRQVLITGLLVFGLGGTSPLWLASLPAILIGRLVLGLGVAAVMTATVALLADQTRGAARGRILGLQAAVMALGGLTFLTLSGWLADMNWRWPFAAYAAAWLLLPAVLLVLPADPPPARGAAERFRLPPGLGPLLVAGVLGMLIIFLVPTQLPFLLHERLGASGRNIGLAISLMTVAAATSSFLFARVQRRLGSPLVLVLSFAVFVPGLLGISLAASWPAVFASTATIGIAVGLISPNLNLWVTTLVPPAQRGRAVGALTSAFFLGQFASPLAASPLVSAGLPLGQVFQAGAALAGLTAVGVLALRLREPESAE